MTSKIEGIITEYEELLSQINSPEIYSDTTKLKDISTRLNELEKVYTLAKKHQQLSQESSEAKILLESNTDREFAENIINTNIHLLRNIESSIDSVDSEVTQKNSPCIFEIRAGTGGEEASIFAGDLFEMYTKFCSSKGWRIELLSANEGSKGGYKEVFFAVNNEVSYSQFAYESGIHRVQRVPTTESSGRIHTSAASVVVYPIVTQTEFKINPEDIEVFTYRSSGPGGQSVNTTDSAIRIRHIPTDLVVTCQDNKSQHKNKEQALKLLRSKLFNLEQEKSRSHLDTVRKTSIKSGDRSEKIRTYNFPQNRVTDHRINKSWFNLESIMNGEISTMLDDVISQISNKNDTKEN